MEKFCRICGTALERKELPGEGLIPYCSHCQQFRFPTFSTAVHAVVVNRHAEEILLIKQYQRDHFILPAGYITIEENAEEALARELREELDITVLNHHYVKSSYYSRSNTLMLAFLAEVNSNYFSSNEEIDFASWFSYDDAKEQILTGSLAEKMLLSAMKLL